MSTEERERLIKAAETVAREFRDFAAVQENSLLTGWNLAVATSWIRFAGLLKGDQ